MFADCGESGATAFLLTELRAQRRAAQTVALSMWAALLGVKQLFIIVRVDKLTTNGSLQCLAELDRRCEPTFLD